MIKHILSIQKWGLKAGIFHVRIVKVASETKILTKILSCQVFAGLVCKLTYAVQAHIWPWTVVKSNFWAITLFGLFFQPLMQL